jgi:hypothetical protein
MSRINISPNNLSPLRMYAFKIKRNSGRRYSRFLHVNSLLKNLRLRLLTNVISLFCGDKMRLLKVPKLVVVIDKDDAGKMKNHVLA